MFGYIKADRANLLGKEYDAYKGVYCALCKQLGKDYSIFARFILSYDCTFYAMLIMSLSEEPPCFKEGRCRFDPLKKCLYAESDTQALSMAAALSVSSAYFKLRDNIIDSPLYKRILYRLVQPIFSRWRRKSRSRYPMIDKAVEDMYRAQIAAEKSDEVNIDTAAEPTAKMLAAVCSMIPDTTPMSSDEPTKNKRILSAFGYYLGRWIYLIDAADDYEKDVKKGLFNPYIKAVGDNTDIASIMRPTLNHALSEALLSYGLLDKGRYDSIVLNVLNNSCVNIQNKILSKYKDNGSTERS